MTPAPQLDLIGVGECMVELSADGALGEAATLRRAYGGDVLNALVTAARLGSRTGFVTRVGHDPFGPGLLGAWRAQGVDTSCAPLVEGENGVYFISLTPDGGREFTYRRSGSAASRLSPADLNAEYFAAGRAVLLSGITQAISDSARAATLSAAQLAKQRGLLVAFDPNYRPALWAARGARAAARAAFLELAPYLDVLLPSFPADTEGLLGVRAELPAALSELRAVAPGARVLAVKAGAQGAWLLDEGGARHVPAFPGSVLDTTGAGDAWNGAFLHHVLRGDTSAHAARAANRVASATLAHRGAIPPRGALLAALAAFDGHPEGGVRRVPPRLIVRESCGAQASQEERS